MVGHELRASDRDGSHGTAANIAGVVGQITGGASASADDELGGHQGLHGVAWLLSRNEAVDEVEVGGELGAMLESRQVETALKETDGGL